MSPSSQGHKPGPEARQAEPFPIMGQFLTYMEAVLGRSPLTVKEYRYDLSLFFRYLLRLSGRSSATDWEQAEISGIDLAFLQKIQLNDAYAFLAWLGRERSAGPANRARKVAALRAFFKYCCHKEKLFSPNPMQDLESPKQLKKLPKYLNLAESEALLRVADQSDQAFSARNYCILTLFLNCGLRLSELSGIRLSDLQGDHLRVLGKGGKERTVYLNEACQLALEQYLAERPQNLDEASLSYLFISRQKRPMSNAAIQRMIKQSLKRAGLDSQRFSTHKLRHTAATLLYQYGKVDIRMLQQILGHSSVATTEIYTHTNSEQLHEAVERNPLAQLRPGRTKGHGDRT